MDINFLYRSIPVILMLHELEEWNILNWYHRYYMDPPPSDRLAVRTWILFLSLVGFIWTGISVAIPIPQVTAFLMGLLIIFTVINAIQHLYWVYLFRAYSPGVIFATAGLAAGLYTCMRILQEGLLPSWLIAVMLLAVIPEMYETAKAGNTMTKSIRGVHIFGMKLAERIWLK